MLLFAIPRTSELLLIGAVVLMMFGGNKIPELMKNLGKTISGFKQAKANLHQEVNELYPNNNGLQDCRHYESMQREGGMPPFSDRVFVNQFLTSIEE